MAAGEFSRWGNSTYYQTGSGSTAAIVSPTVLGSDTWLDVATGWYHTIAIQADGSLWGWGYNADGQVGDNSTTTRQTPFEIHAGSFTKVACGKNASFAIKTDGTLWGWGDGGWGQMASGGYSDVLVPTQIGVATWTDVAAGEQHVLAIKTDGTLWSWGTGNQEQLGLGATTEQLTPAQIGSASTWVSVAAGYQNSFAIKSDGTLWGWGEGWNGELGDGAESRYNTPTQIGTDTNWAAVSSGKYHTLALKTTGTLWGTGYNSTGELGDGSTIDKITFTQVGSDTDWSAISCQEYQSLALKTDDTLWVAGENSMYQLGTGAATDVTGGFTQNGVEEYQIISAGYFHGAAILVAPLAGSVTESYTDFAGSSDVLEDTIQLTTDGAATSETLVSIQSTNQTSSETASSGEAITIIYSPTQLTSDGVAAADAIESAIFTLYTEGVGLSDLLASTSNTTSALSDNASLVDVIQAAIHQIVTDTADGADLIDFSAAVTLVDIADAVATQAPSYNSVLLVAELIATIEAWNGADGYDVVEEGQAAEVFAARVEAYVALLDSHYIQDVNTATVSVYQIVTDTADGASLATYTGSLLTSLLGDTVAAVVRLNIGGELFTGWVMNTDTLAASEYQFVDRQFNSACKHGDRYLMAADDGIYAFTETRGVESVMTYIKTGKMDFGSDLKKRVVNSYMVYSATGQMVLKVTTSEFGQLVTRNYKMVPPSDSETTDTRRFDLGKGIRSRYWQFELVGDGVDCDIDEIGMLPVLLSRRI